MVPDQEVPDALIARLCGLATWALNHKRTWPWRLAHLTGQGRAKLGEAFATDLLAAGLASFWSSPPTRVAPTALALVGFEPDTQLVGVVYLGWPAGEAVPPQRPVVVVNRVA
jgi:nitroreductase